MQGTIIAVLLAAAWPLVKKVLLALGIGFLSYEGVSTLTSSLIGLVQSNFSGITGATLQIISLAGFPEAVGIMCGALTARAALVAVGKIGKVAA